MNATAIAGNAVGDAIYVGFHRAYVGGLGAASLGGTGFWYHAFKGVNTPEIELSIPNSPHSTTFTARFRKQFNGSFNRLEWATDDTQKRVGEFGTYQLETKTAGMCLRPLHPIGVGHAELHQEDCDPDEEGMKWLFNNIGDSGAASQEGIFEIRNFSDGTCMAAPVAVKGESIKQIDCDTSSLPVHQQSATRWQVLRGTWDKIMLQSTIDPDLCVRLPKEGAADSGLMLTLDYCAYADKHFRFIPKTKLGVVNNEKHSIHTVTDLGCLELISVVGSSQTIVQNDCKISKEQEWTFTESTAKPGYYQIKANDLCMQIAQTDMLVGGKISPFVCADATTTILGAENQLWKPLLIGSAKERGAAVTFASAQSDLCIEIERDQANPLPTYNNPLFQNTCLPNVQDQMFKIVNEKFIAKGVLDQNPNRHLLSVIKNPVNKLNFFSAQQSSVMGDDEAEYGAELAYNGQRPTDGYTDVSQTKASGYSYWQGDLGEIKNLHSITIFNRQDCCGLLKNFYILVSDEEILSDSLEQARNDANIEIYQQDAIVQDTNEHFYNFLFPQEATGRYVRIQLNEEKSLALAEVEVYGNSLAAVPDHIFEIVGNPDTAVIDFAIQSNGSWIDGNFNVVVNGVLIELGQITCPSTLSQGSQGTITWSISSCETNEVGNTVVTVSLTVENPDSEINLNVSSDPGSAGWSVDFYMRPVISLGDNDNVTTFVYAENLLPPVSYSVPPGLSSTENGLINLLESAWHATPNQKGANFATSSNWNYGPKNTLKKLFDGKVFDGEISFAEPTAKWIENGVWSKPGESFEISLGYGQYGVGYDIRSIESIMGHKNNPLFTSQNWSIEVKKGVLGEWKPLREVDFDVYSDDPDLPPWSVLRWTDSIYQTNPATGLVEMTYGGLAKGVTDIRISFTAGRPPSFLTELKILGQSTMPVGSFNHIKGLDFYERSGFVCRETEGRWAQNCSADVAVTVFEVLSDGTEVSVSEVDVNNVGAIYKPVSYTHLTLPTTPYV